MFLFPTVDLRLLGQLAPKELYGPLLLKLRNLLRQKVAAFRHNAKRRELLADSRFHNPHWLRTKPGFILHWPTYVGAIVDGRGRRR